MGEAPASPWITGDAFYRVACASVQQSRALAGTPSGIRIAAAATTSRAPLQLPMRHPDRRDHFRPPSSDRVDQVHPPSPSPWRKHQPPVPWPPGAEPDRTHAHPSPARLPGSRFGVQPPDNPNALTASHRLSPRRPCPTVPLKGPLSTPPLSTPHRKTGDCAPAFAPTPPRLAYPAGTENRARFEQEQPDCPSPACYRQDPCPPLPGSGKGRRLPDPPRSSPGREIASGLAARSQSSVSAAPSASGPASSASLRRPELSRTPFSMTSAISGLSFKNCRAFSRPWPSRWLS